VDAEGAARRAREGTAVSSGDSSAAQRPAALNPDGQPQPEPDPDATLPQGAPSPVPIVNRAAAPAQPKSNPSDAATVAESRRPRDPSSGSTQQVFASIGATIFEVGSVLGGRYEIQALLGMGGMGAVYKAHDLEVDRAVGLKVIRPDLAGNPAILARFKQELILARQVTHKNIIRIYDLSEAEGVKFITMEFIEGEDLRTILTRQGKLTSDEAISIMRQACTGLQAAHAEDVIHRDLKPSNIMRDTAGRVVIMDFGLAKTVTGDGMTQTGMMIGTMEYMSPEQAMGTELDARSDIFAVGLIFYELMTGNMPYRAESAIASLVKRTQERAAPLHEVDPTVSIAVSHIVSKCLERDPKNRYSSIQELLDDLDIAQGKVPGQVAARAVVPRGEAVTEGAPSPAIPQPAVKKATGFPRMWLAIAVVLLAVLGVGGYFGYQRFVNRATQASTATISVAIIPYYNNSGDASLDSLSSTLSETLSADVGTSAGIHLVSQSRLQQVLGDLRISAQQQLDLSQLRRIAEITNADTVVTGNYVKLGNQIRINSTVYDGILKGDQQFNIVTNVAGDQNNLVSSISQLSLDVRDKLASNPDMLKELESSAPPKLTNSAPALSAYSEGLQLYRAGKYPEAAKKFEDATGDDPTFAMAFSQLGLAYKQLGNDDKAQVASNKAVTLSDNLQGSQKFLIQANDAVINNNTTQAIAAYEKLTAANPDDTDAQLELAALYDNASNYDAERARLAKVRSLDKNNPDVLYSSGRVEIQAGKPQDGLEFLSGAYNLATRSGNEPLKAKILQAQGIAYRDLNQPTEALKNFQDSLAISRPQNLQSAMAKSLAEIGVLQDRMGDSAAGLKSLNESLDIRRSIGNKSGIALSLLALGKYYNDHAKFDEALKYLNEALNDFRDLNDLANQAICLNNIGTAQDGLSNYQAALTYYGQSYDISHNLKRAGDMAQALHNLADMNVKIGRYDDAIGQYVKGIDTATEAGDQDRVALVSTSLGELYATQGQYGQALKSYEAAIKDFQAANDHTYLMGAALAGYGRVLSMIGRSGEGQQKLQEAVKLLTDVNSNKYLTQALNWLGDSYMYSGKYDDARQQYKKAADVADRAKDREQSAVSRFGMARLDVMQAHSAAAIPVLQKLGRETDALGLKALSVQASLYLARAELAANKPQLADQELARALNRADKLGLVIEKAQAHYLMGALATVTHKEKQLTSEYRDTVNTLESISKQPGMEHLLDREDLKGIYQDALKSAFQGT
jgi:serine/threonine protein kinase/tetratricopeptide (TPR) repeat protein